MTTSTPAPRPSLLAPHLGGAALAAALALGCGGSKPAPAPPAPTTAAPHVLRFDAAALERLGVKVAPAGRQQGEARLSVPGSIEYSLEHYAEIGTLLPGRVASVRVRVGDPVRKGQTLATVTIPAIAEAQADYLAARASNQVAREHTAREQKLLADKLTTAREAEVALGDSLKSEAQMRAAAARLQALGVDLPDRGERGEINARGSLALTAPLDGVVVRRDAVLGGFLEPSDKAFVVADPRQLWATVEIYESDLPFVDRAGEVELTVEALARSLRGRITLLEPHLGAETRTLRARIPLDNADGSLRPGLFVKARLPLKSGDPAAGLMVPAAAVQPIGGHDVVFVQREPGLFEVRPVRPGRRTAQVVQIAEGLQAGEPIAVEGTFLLRGEVTRQ